MRGGGTPMKPVPAFVPVFLLFSVMGAAQGRESLSKFELRGSGGWIAFADESLINHALAGVSLRVSLTGGLGLEPELTYMVGPGDDRDIVFAPVISWEIGKKKVRPYVLGAAVVLWHRERDFWG